MGDRANVVIPMDGEPPVYLYTHWGGSNLPETVQKALDRHQRWDDPPYLARIIFCEMVRGCEQDETGFGIATYPPDNGHPLLVVDCKAKLVGLANDAAPEARRTMTKKVLKVYKSWTFDEFIALDSDVVFAEDEE